MDASELAAQVRAGELSAQEAVTAAIETIERLNPSVNAVVIPLFERALERASSGLSGPFAGVPLLLKDLGAAVKGMRQHQGSQLLRRLDWRAGATAPLMERILAAGFVPVGKTNVPEFGAGATTQPLAYGPTRNPWDLSRSTSGSSGGSAAAVATGMVSVAHANDFGGSIRMPAAWCGVIGLKPSSGLTTVPSGPQSEFALTTTLRDTAALLDVFAEPGQRPVGGGTWAESLAVDPPRLRIGLVTAVAGVDTDEVCADAVRHATTLLAGVGHDIVELGADFLADDRWNDMQRRLRARNSAATVRGLEQIKGAPLTAEDAEPMLLALASLSAHVSDEEYDEARAWDESFGPTLDARWERQAVDVVMTPTTGITPRLLEEMAPPVDEPAAAYLTYRRVGCFAGLWNKTGRPALSMPWWTRTSTLPLGIQIVAPLLRDDLTLQVARILTEVAPEETTVSIAHPA